jgi:hypothetical protein
MWWYMHVLVLYRSKGNNVAPRGPSFSGHYGMGFSHVLRKGSDGLER